MMSKFRHVALVGKYQSSTSILSSSDSDASRQILQDIAEFLQSQGCQVVLHAETAAHMGLSDFSSMDVDAIGEHCDACVVCLMIPG